MKITLTQPTQASWIWMDIESRDVCLRIYTSNVFEPYEKLYIWLGHIRDCQLPVSMVIDEEGHGVELVAERVDDEMILFKVDPWLHGNFTTTHLAIEI